MNIWEFGCVLCVCVGLGGGGVSVCVYLLNDVIAIALLNLYISFRSDSLYNFETCVGLP